MNCSPANKISAKSVTQDLATDNGRLREPYIWHLSPPFKTQFDGRHWWGKHPDTEKIGPVGALYELARRHPMIGEARCKFRDANWHGIELRDPPPSGKAKQKLVNLAFIDLGKMPSAIHCLCLIGLKSWENLSPQDRDFWEDTVGSIKGLDCRSDLERCATINNDVLTDILIGIASKLKRKHKGKTTAAFNKLVAHEFLQCECPDDKFEAAFSNYAISALRNDYILIAIARDLKTEVAASLLEQRYRQHQAMHQVPKQRARFENWLPLISEFEDDQIGHRKAKSQVFVRYRRALDSIHFMSGGHGIHNARCRHILAVREFFLQEIFKAMAELSAEKKS